VCGTRYDRAGNVWNLVIPEDDDRFAQFVAEYTRIRRGEGRNYSAQDLRMLPELPRNHPLAWEWHVRSGSFRRLTQRVIGRRTGMRVLDAGAGNGWLSHRLARAGHYPLATDLRVDDEDGLGAATAFDIGALPLFPRVRAAFERLPVASGQADLVVFNACLHYASDRARVLEEARRVLAGGGRIAIMDSPFYRHQEDASRMLTERRAAFAAAYGTESVAHGGPEYFLWAEIPAMAAVVDAEWQTFRPWHGIRFTSRPVVARLRRRRAPASFPLVVLRPRGPSETATG
jgi:SAM-dependent methyltransferase